MCKSKKIIRSSKRQRRGSVILYASVALVVVCGFVSLAVDYGRVQIAKTELQSAADLAARYAASGVKHQIDGVNAAPAMARAALAENKVDARIFQNTQSTVDVGVWNVSSESFTPTSNATLANAVRVTLRCQNVDGSAIPTGFASVLGFRTKELTAKSIALYDEDNNYGGKSKSKGAIYQQKYVPATSNIWLAGSAVGKKASKGNPHNNEDTAGKQSPVEMDTLRVVPGSTLQFDGVNGGATNDYNDPSRYTGDGNLGQIVENYTGAELGKSNLSAPINAVIGVFLDDNEPDNSPPPDLDFSTDASRNFQTLKPQLAQVFFIGDGRRANGDMQQFVIPPKATRLFIGTMDSYEWNNNIGGFTVTTTATAKIVTVK